MTPQRNEPEKLIYRLRNIREAYPRLLLFEKNKAGLVEELTSVQRDARTFGETHVRPVALELDRKMHEDSGHFDWNLVKKGMEYGFLSYIIPKPFGGKGYFTTHFAVLMEELCSHCPGVGNIFGAHALGLTPILMSPDIRHYARYMQPVARAEKRGEPLLFALAITEPEAGSDVEDADEYPSARLTTHARKVDGGYILNGRKVFISNGSVARYIWVGAVLDKKRPIETSVSLMVPSTAKGFSVGRVEKKMGQRACPAAELIFEDVFVPEEDRVGDEGEGERLIGLVLGASRGPVGAIATGIARGAFERLLDYLNTTKANGRYLFEHQWCQIMLTDLMTKIQIARQLYFDSALCCDLLGVPKLMNHPLMKMLDLVPEVLMQSGMAKRFFTSQWMYGFVKRLAERNIRTDDVSLIASYSSMAKYVASDIAVEVTSKAMEIMGEDGPVAAYGIEKLYRDAKLTQIYEGTNQINRLYAFKNCLCHK
ncbi:MAG TPA: acyl-CoA dehydrogenase family protein [Candidatus Hydrogenedentes bacterium]|nr:acyl-CoA dehydrogenase family protein [Candidatus Hydrogenedentota bacterium]